jgi:hypothetical protein
VEATGSAGEAIVMFSDELDDFDKRLIRDMIDTELAAFSQWIEYTYDEDEHADHKRRLEKLREKVKA